jgi:DNA-binding response OmpR family regulator
MPERPPLVLVVDDEENIRYLVESGLRLAGLDSVSASDGRAALSIVSERRPDLIVLDVMMPKIDGFEVCRALKTKGDTKDIPIILLTAKDRENDRKKGEEVGVDRYMTKPFSPQRLISTIHEMLGVAPAN